MSEREKALEDVRERVFDVLSGLEKWRQDWEIPELKRILARECFERASQ